MIRRYGFIHEKLEIKILILFVLNRLPEPVSLEELAELAICDDGISYFEFADCVSDLIRTEHIKSIDNLYSVTEKGLRNGSVTENSLPYSIRVAVENSTSAHRGKQARNAMIKAQHISNDDDSSKVMLSLSDGLGEILAMELYAVNENQAIDYENGFRKNAESIYNKLIEMLLIKK